MTTFRYCPVCAGELATRQVKAGEMERPVCTRCGYVIYLDPKVAVGTIIALTDDVAFGSDEGPRPEAARSVLGREGPRSQAARSVLGREGPRSEAARSVPGREGPRSEAARSVLGREGPQSQAARSVLGRSEPLLVLVRRSIEPGYGLWVFPGGYVDRGERPEDAAVREAREECGLDVRLDALINVYSYAGRTPIILAYAATAIGGTLCADDECLEARLFAPAEIPWTELAFPSTREALTDFLAGLRHPLR